MISLWRLFEGGEEEFYGRCSNKESARNCVSKTFEEKYAHIVGGSGELMDSYKEASFACLDYFGSLGFMLTMQDAVNKSQRALHYRQTMSTRIVGMKEDASMNAVLNAMAKTDDLYGRFQLMDREMASMYLSAAHSMQQIGFDVGVEAANEFLKDCFKV
jgi:hypothetical protein